MRNCVLPSTASAVGAKNQKVRPLKSACPGWACEKVDVMRVQLEEEWDERACVLQRVRAHASIARERTIGLDAGSRSC